MKKRKIIQISARQHTIVALCDDGTVWIIGEDDWEQLDTSTVETAEGHLNTVERTTEKN